MFVETMDVAYTSRRRTKGHQLVSLIIALVFALTIYPSKAHAQIVGDLEVNIHSSFTRETPSFRQASTSFTCSTTPI